VHSLCLAFSLLSVGVIFIKGPAETEGHDSEHHIHELYCLLALLQLDGCKAKKSDRRVGLFQGMNIFDAESHMCDDNRGWCKIVMVVKVMRPGLSAADDTLFTDWPSPGWRNNVDRMSGDGTRVLQGWLIQLRTWGMCLNEGYVEESPH
jgi:hypothetical protein